MKLHKRILSAVAAFLVLTSAIDLTQIAQLSVVAAAESVGDGENGGDTGNGDENGGEEDNGDGDGDSGDGDSGDGDENGDGNGETPDDKTPPVNEDGDPTDGSTPPANGNGETPNVPSDDTGDIPGDTGEPTPGGSTGSGSVSGDTDKIGITFTYNDLQYEITGSDTVSVGASINLNEVNVVIPSKVTYENNEYTVTAIGVSAFFSWSDIESITIPDSVTSIGDDAFGQCKKLTKIVIPENVTVIGKSAFSECTALETVELPSSLKSLGNGAFTDCDNLNTVKFNGTQKEWEKINGENNNLDLPENITVDCSDDTVVTETWNGNVPPKTISADTEITLDGNVKLQGRITVESGNVTINGDGNTITRAEEFLSTMMIVNEGATVTINNIIFDGENKDKVNGAIISNDGALTINSSVIKNNINSGSQTRDNGIIAGGIANNGTLELTDSAVYGNTAANGQSNIETGNRSAVTVNSGLIVGDIDGSVTRNNDVARGTINTNVDGAFTVKNTTNEVVCENGDVLYAIHTPDLKAVVDGKEIDIDYDNLTWNFSIDKPVQNLTETDIANGITIDGDAIITLNNDITLTGEINIKSGNVTIIGNGHTITRGERFWNPMVEVNEGATVDITNVIFDGNKANSGGIWSNGEVISNKGTLKIDRSVIKNNSTRASAGGDGDFFVYSGGIRNSGILELTNSTIEGNVGYSIGAIGNNGVAKIANCDISNNSGAGVGAIGNRGTLEITNSIIRDNKARNNNGVGGISCEVAPGENAPTPTVIVNSGSIYNNTRGDNNAQSNVKLVAGAEITVNGGLIVGEIVGGTVRLGSSIRKGTIDTNAKGSFDVMNPYGDVVKCKNGDVLYANYTYDLRAVVGEDDNAENVRITYDSTNSKWTFRVKDDTDYITWNAGDVINGITIDKDTVITLNGNVTLTSTINIQNGNVTINGNDHTITRGNFSGSMLSIGENAEVTVKNTVLDGNKANISDRTTGTVIRNNGVLKIDHSEIKNNNNRSEIGGLGDNSHTTSSGILNWGDLELTNSTIKDNNAWYGSGALTNVGDAKIVNCEIYNNTSTLIGGVDNHGKLEMINSSVHDNKVIDYDRGVGGIAGCTDNYGMTYAHSETTLTGCSVYGNTKLGTQSNVRLTGNNRMFINDSLIVGEITGNGTPTLGSGMNKGIVTARANDYFTVSNSTNPTRSVVCKIGDVLYARPDNLKATIGNKTYNAVYKNSRWVFSDTYTITYNLNGGSISGSFANPQTYLYGDVIAFPTVTRNGYTFGGWYSDAALTQAVNKDLIASSNATFFAKWTKKPGTSDPGTSTPGTSNPGTSTPGTSNPGTSTPGTSNPGTSQPGGSSDLINKNVVLGVNAPETQIISTISDLIRYVLTNADLNAIKPNQRIDFTLSVTNINGTASQTDRSIIETFIASIANYRLGYLLDISLSKNVGSVLSVVRETSGELIIRITVPENLRATDRSFAIVRVHNGSATFLEDLDNNPNTITFKTDRFSTYAIIYKDQKGGSGTTTDPSNPETGNRTHPAVMIAPVASSLTLVVTAKRKKKEEE